MIDPPHLLLGCDSFLALRNARNADVGRAFGELGCRTTALVDPHQLAGSRRANVPGLQVEPLEDFSLAAFPRIRRPLGWMNLARRGYHDPGTHRSKLGYRLSERRWARFMVGPLLAAGWIAGALGIYRNLRRKVEEELRGTETYRGYRSRLEADRPALVVGFSPEGYREIPLMMAARDLGVPTVIMIRSRDNLVSKIPFLPEADEYLVWSEHQREYLRRLYPEMAHVTVSVVGSPQFSRHLDPAHRLERPAFFSTLGLDPDRPLVALCLENPLVAPLQHRLALALADACEAGELGDGTQLLVRNHPRAFGSDYDPLEGRSYSSVRRWPPPTDVPFGSHDDDLVHRVLEDEEMHLATMAFQDVNVNIMSTVTIDSALLDKPIVQAAFDIPEAVPRAQSVHRFYERHDARVIERSGAVVRARDFQELLRHISEALLHPERRRDARAALVAQDLGTVGPAANRAVRERMGHHLRKSVHFERLTDEPDRAVGEFR